MILVTGGTGFIGRRLVGRLARQCGPPAVTCLTYIEGSSPAERAGAAALQKLGVRCIPIDLLDGRGLERIPRSPDIVFHLASNIDTGARDHRIDDLGLRNLLEALSPLRPSARFVFTSSIAVMDHRIAPDLPATETSRLLRPRNEYGRRKLLAEEYLRECAGRQGFGAVIARLSAVYGEGVRHAGVFGQIDRMVRQDAWVSRLDYPGQLSLIHVDDVVEILLRLSRWPSPEGQVQLVLPATEVMALRQVIAAGYAHHGKRYRPIRLPRWFWRTCDAVSAGLLRLEPFMPHTIHNKLWQLGLTVNGAFQFDPAETQRRFPDMVFRRFQDSLDEIW